jgi:Laminin B (Domain IV)
MSTSDLIEGPRPVLTESRFEGAGVKHGWTHSGDCTLTHSLTEGNPGGCLKAKDAVVGGVFYYVAPKFFLGDKKDAFQLDYDIKWVASSSLPIFPWDNELELTGGGGTVLTYRAGTPTINKWVHVSVPLSPSGGWFNKAQNRPATDDDFKAVLNSLERLAIRGEFAHGGPEFGFLDNVVMYQATVGNPEGQK